MINEGKGISVWNGVVNAAMKLPIVKVDREMYLRETFRKYCTNEQMQQIIDTAPAVVLNTEVIEKAAQSCVNSSVRSVTAISAAAGIPGGWAVFGTVPADVAQYYGHVFNLAQKLAYIYGYPSLQDENGSLSEEARSQLTILVGVMSGVAAANEALKAMTKELAEQIIKRVPRMALTKTFFYPLIKKVGAWIGVSITKGSFARGLSKIVPILGGVTSGALTYATFKPGAKRLNKSLREEMEIIKESYTKSNKTNCL